MNYNIKYNINDKVKYKKKIYDYVDDNYQYIEDKIKDEL